MLHTSFDEPYQLGHKTVTGRFVIPSGIRCTHAATIERCFLEVPSVGVITTKSIGVQPRKGYREPIYARYAPGCYINAVGLANPGAEAYMAEFEGIQTPGDKFLLVSIMGSDVDSFAAAALTLEPIADGFELNMSCPHAKGYGAEVGQDTELLRAITEAVVCIAEAPVFVKLSGVLPNLAGSAAIAIGAGAAGITLTNTIGPAMAEVGVSPILHNRVGGLSGDGIRPLGLRAVEQEVRRRGPFGLEFSGDGAGRFGVAIHDADQFGILQPRVDTRVLLAEMADADDSDLETAHATPPRSCRVTSRYRPSLPVSERRINSRRFCAGFVIRPAASS